MAKQPEDSSKDFDWEKEGKKQFDPAEMRRRVERLKREGRMPTEEQWLAAKERAREVYRPKVLAARRLWEKKHGPEPGPKD